MGVTRLSNAWLGRLRMEQSMRLIKSGICGTGLRTVRHDQAHFSGNFQNHVRRTTLTNQLSVDNLQLLDFKSR